jgi:hypothetical protein
VYRQLEPPPGVGDLLPEIDGLIAIFCGQGRAG